MASESERQHVMSFQNRARADTSLLLSAMHVVILSPRITPAAIIRFSHHVRSQIRLRTFPQMKCSAARHFHDFFTNTETEMIMCWALSVVLRSDVASTCRRKQRQLHTLISSHSSHVWDKSPVALSLPPKKDMCCTILALVVFDSQGRRGVQETPRNTHTTRLVSDLSSVVSVLIFLLCSDLGAVHVWRRAVGAATTHPTHHDHLHMRLLTLPCVSVVFNKFPTCSRNVVLVI